MNTVEEKIEKLIKPVLEDEGVEIVDIELKPFKSGSILTVYIDKEGGVDLDTCEDISQLISPLLDVHDLVEGKYYLEVSSPGIERRIGKPKDFKKYVGERVKLTAREKINGRRNFTGKLIDAGDKSITLQDEKGKYHINYDLIKKANLVVEIEF